MFKTHCLSLLLVFFISCAVKGQNFESFGFDDSFFVPGFNGDIYGMIEFEGQRIVYGAFTMINKEKAIGIATWDGSKWVQFGEELYNDDRTGWITTAVLYGGELYIAGVFNRSESGTDLSNIAKWGDSKWVTVENGLDDYVSNLVVYEDELIAAGNFINSGERQVNGFARWNGSEWNPMEFRVNDLTYINDIEVRDSEMLISGGLEYITGNTVLPEGSFLGSYSFTQLDTAFYQGDTEQDWWLFASGFDRVRQFSAQISETGTRGEDRKFSIGIKGESGYFSSYTGRLIFSDSTENSHQNVTVFSASAYSFECDDSDLTRSYEPGVDMRGTFDPQDDTEFTFVVRDTNYDCEGSPPREIRFKVEKINSKTLAKTTRLPEVVNSILLWNGTEVENFDGGLNGGTAVSTAFHDDMVVANKVGTDENYNYYNEVMVWNGSSWEIIGERFDGRIMDIESIDGELIVAGYFTAIGDSEIKSIAKWNGVSWEQYGPTPDFTVIDIEKIGNELVAEVVDYDGRFISNTAIYDNGVWTFAPYNTGGKGITGTIFHALYQDEILYLAGGFEEAGATKATNFATHDSENGFVSYSQELSNFSPWVPAYQLNVDKGEIILGGSFQAVISDSLYAISTMKWENGIWKNMGFGLSSSVFKFREFNDTLFALGTFTRSEYSISAGIAKWDGENWIEAGDVDLGWMRDGVIKGSDFFMAGYDSRGDSALIVKWDGDTWFRYSNHGLPGNSAVKAMTFLNDELYIAHDVGYYENDGSGYISKWNGEAWTQVGGEFDNQISALINHEGTLVAGGVYTAIDEIEVGPLVYWDGDEWQDFDDFETGKVYSLQSIEDGVLFGGNFIPHGNFNSHSLGLLITNPNYASTEPVNQPFVFKLNGNYPNPFNPITNIEFELGSAGNVQIEVFDIVGRKVTTIANQYFSVGTHTVPFSANNLSSGVYLYRIKSNSVVKTGKMLLLK